MIAIKAIQTSLTGTKHAFFQTGRPFKRKNYYLCLSQPSDSSSDASSPEGDTRKQELLARIAMMQAEKVRLTDFLDERSAYLTELGEKANAEFDKSREDALKGLDEAGDRIMENMESRMQAFEESAEMNRQGIEQNQNKLSEFEGQMEKDRNEGLFFKNLGKSTPVDKAKAKEEMEKISEATKESAGSKTRRNIYLALIGLVVIGIADSFLSSSSDWRKVAVLGAILVALLSQFFYEQSMFSETQETEETEKGKTGEEKK